MKVFIASTDAVRSKHFYGDLLELPLVSEDSYGLEFESGAGLLRVVFLKEGQFHPQDFTIAGWKVEDIGKTIAHLSLKGISFERYKGLEQDSLGIWTAPGGTQVAWFKDPDGNLLSINN